MLPDLCIGVIEAVFHSDGNTPSLNERLKMMRAGAANEIAHCLTNEGGRRSAPAPFEESIDSSFDSTSCSEKITKGQFNEYCGRPFKYDSNKGGELLLNTLRKNDENRFAESDGVSAVIPRKCTF